jgi:molecular chaperone GrpE
VSDQPELGTPTGSEPDGPAREEPKELATVPLTAQQELDRLRGERDELRDQLLRRRADFENYKKRVERDRQQAGLEAAADVLQALVPTLDNLDRALGAQGPDSSLREGVELVRRDLLALVEGRGVTAQDPLGQPFDPTLHQALSYEPAPGFQDGTVVEVFRKGYFLGGRLLRPALVKVARAPEGSEPGEKEAVH